MPFLEGQIETHKARIAYWHAMIVSGAYKGLAVAHADRERVPEDMREEVITSMKLERAMIIMKNHVELLRDACDALPSSASDVLREA